MNRITALKSGLLVFCLAPLHSAMATVTYSDGGTHTISSSSPDVSLSNSTTLNITSGAVVNGPSGSPGGPAVSAYDSTANHIQVTGGSITGGSNPQPFAGFAGHGIDMVGGTLDISSGTLSGGTASFVPGAAVWVTNTQSTISGGTFYGGDITASGYANDAVVVNGGNMTISGGTFYGGDGYLAGIALSLGKSNISPPPHVVVTGGTFTAGTGLGPDLYGAYSVAIGYNYPGAVLDLKGGHFVGAFLMEPGTVLNVYGYGLTATAITHGRHIAGTLLDGTPLSLNTFVYDPVTINLINVPEPGTLVLCGFAFVSWAAWSRRRRNRHV